MSNQSVFNNGFLLFAAFDFAAGFAFDLAAGFSLGFASLTLSLGPLFLPEVHSISSSMSSSAEMKPMTLVLTTVPHAAGPIATHSSLMKVLSQKNRSRACSEIGCAVAVANASRNPESCWNLPARHRATKSTVEVQAR